MRSLVAAYIALLVTLTALGAIGGFRLYSSWGPDDAAEAAADDHAYDFLTWEAQHIPRKWLYKVRHMFDGRSVADEEQSLSKYFGSKGSKEGEAAVEDIIEGRITTVLKDQGLAMEPPLFSDLGLVFPPVDFELDAPPRVLAVSPRDGIELEHSLLLEPGLDREQFDAIEREAESENGPQTGISAVVVGTGGVATYPAVISSSHTYEQIVETAFHEWVHQYLAFYPLGRNYFAGSDLRTLNETAANLAGEALAAEYFNRYPQLEAEATPPPSTPQADTAQPVFDFTKEMRELRRTVEEMLARGQILDAEALMEAKRQELGEHGYSIRRLNQAYFAFHGSYADTPGSIDPIGPKMQTLLGKSGSPGAFVRLAAGITSRSELDQVLARVS